MSKLTESLIRAWFITMGATIVAGPLSGTTQNVSVLGTLTSVLFITLFIIAIVLGVAMMIGVFVDTEKDIRRSKAMIAERSAHQH